MHSRDNSVHTDVWRVVYEVQGDKVISYYQREVGKDRVDEKEVRIDEGLNALETELTIDDRTSNRKSCLSNDKSTAMACVMSFLHRTQKVGNRIEVLLSAKIWFINPDGSLSEGNSVSD